MNLMIFAEQAGNGEISWPGAVVLLGMFLFFGFVMWVILKHDKTR